MFSDSQFEAVRAFPRQALHARSLTLVHPEDGQKARFEAPLPEDMKTLLACLQSD